MHVSNNTALKELLIGNPDFHLTLFNLLKDKLWITEFAAFVTNTVVPVCSRFNLDSTLLQVVKDNCHNTHNISHLSYLTFIVLCFKIHWKVNMGLICKTNCLRHVSLRKSFVRGASWLLRVRKPFNVKFNPNIFLKLSSIISCIQMAPRQG